MRVAFTLPLKQGPNMDIKHPCSLQKKIMLYVICPSLMDSTSRVCRSPCPIPFIKKNSLPFDGMFQLAVGRRFGFPPLDASTPPFFCVSLSLPWTEWPKRSLFPNVWIFSWSFGFDLKWTYRSPFFRLTRPTRLKCVKA